jgi:hypothetical protein
MLRFLVFIFSALVLVAAEYVDLGDRVIYLGDDGRWQEVKIIQKDGEEIAIKSDGTWEYLGSKKIITAKEAALQNRSSVDTPLARKLLGHWKGEGVEYRFGEEKATFRIKEGHAWKAVEGKWSVVRADEKKKMVTISIASSLRLGPVSFGGVVRKLRFENDATLVDETQKISGRVYTLERVK